MGSPAATPATTTTTRKFDSYESIVKLGAVELQQVLSERGVTVVGKDKTTLTSLLLKSVVGEFRLAEDKVQREQTEVKAQLQELATQLTQVKEALGSLQSLQAATPAHQQPQLEEELQQLKGLREELREELKGSSEGWRTVERRMSHQADATQRQLRELNAVLRNFEGKEDESVEDLQQRAAKELSSQLGVAVELAGARRLPTKTPPSRTYAAATAPRPALLLLKFKSAEARSAVFRARAKLAGTTWGLDEDLTPVQQQQRKALQPQFQEARKAGKRPRWKGGELFVDGRPVRPST